MYHKFCGNKYIFLFLNVDNILLANNDIHLLHETNRILAKIFEMKAMVMHLLYWAYKYIEIILEIPLDCFQKVM